MDKKNKAIKGLMCCVNLLCDKCPYAKYEHTEHKFQCANIMHKDLLEVLSSLLVVRKPCYNSNYPDELYCPSCKKRLGFVTQQWMSYCPKCGQKLLYTKGGLNNDIIDNDLSSYS